MEDNVMRVRDLIAALGAFAPDTLVVVRGFDEFGYDSPQKVVAVNIAPYVGAGTHCPEYDAGDEFVAVFIA